MEMIFLSLGFLKGLEAGESIWISFPKKPHRGFIKNDDRGASIIYTRYKRKVVVPFYIFLSLFFSVET